MQDSASDKNDLHVISLMKETEETLSNKNVSDTKDKSVSGQKDSPVNGCMATKDE